MVDEETASGVSRAKDNQQHSFEGLARDGGGRYRQIQIHRTAARLRVLHVVARRSYSPNIQTFQGLFVEYNISTQRSEDVFDTFGAALNRSPELSPNRRKLAFVHYELSMQYYVGLVREYDD